MSVDERLKAALRLAATGAFCAVLCGVGSRLIIAGPPTVRPLPAIAAATVNAAVPAGWPQFLGANRDNISTETGLLKEWPTDGPKLEKSIHGLGIGFSNIAVADGTIYTMGNHGEREFVLAFSLDNGKEVWKYDLAAAYHNGYGDGPRGTPTIDGDQLYALGATGELACLDRKTGRKVWTKSLTKEFGTPIPSWGICESPLIDGDRLICTPGGTGAAMVALDKQTGSLIWKCATPDGDRPAYASIIAIDVGGVRQYVNYTATGVIGVRASDGLFLWRDNSSANGTANCATAVFADGLVLTSSGYGKGASAVGLTSVDGKTTAKFVYHTNDLKNHHGGLVLRDGHVYGSNDPGILTCLDLKTGKTVWQNRSVGKGSLTCADGNLIVRSEQGPVALVEATPTGYKEISRFTPGDRSKSPAWTYPVVSFGKLFLRDQDLLQVYDLKAR